MDMLKIREQLGSEEFDELYWQGEHTCEDCCNIDETTVERIVDGGEERKVCEQCWEKYK